MPPPPPPKTATPPHSGGEESGGEESESEPEYPTCFRCGAEVDPFDPTCCNKFEEYKLEELLAVTDKDEMDKLVGEMRAAIGRSPI